MKYLHLITILGVVTLGFYDVDAKSLSEDEYYVQDMPEEYNDQSNQTHNEVTKESQNLDGHQDMPEALKENQTFDEHHTNTNQTNSEELDSLLRKKRQLIRTRPLNDERKFGHERKLRGANQKKKRSTEGRPKRRAAHPKMKRSLGGRMKRRTEPKKPEMSPKY